MSSDARSSSGTTTLLPCPFCGPGHKVNLVMQHNPEGGWLYEVVCQGCSVTMPCDDSETEAIADWNRRYDGVAQSSQEPAAKALIERSDKYFGNGNDPHEYPSEILRDMTNYLRGLAYQPRDRTAWLIEVDDDEGPIYFQLVDDDNWSSDHNSALQFARKQDAEKYIADIGCTRARAVEHMWPESSARCHRRRASDHG